MSPNNETSRSTPKRLLQFAALALVALLAAGTAAAAGDMWIHVRVDEGDGGARVKVNLPLTMAEQAVQMIPEEHSHGRVHAGKVHIDGLDHTDITVSELRELWNDLRDSADATLIEVEDDGERVLVTKSGGYLLVDVQGSDGEQVDVRVPGAVVDALLSGEGEELDLSAALRALSASGAGELVAVTDDETQVRIWIDATPEAE